MENLENSKSTTFRLTKRPAVLRPFEWADYIANRFDKSFLDFTDATLMEAAERKTGLSDWGDDGFREPLVKLVQSCKQEASLDLVGRLLVRSTILRLLTNRLCIREEIKRKPEILNQEIKRPLFIVSLPRTGTTMLHHVLALDPSNRYLRAWEGLMPALHPKKAGMKPDPRIRSARRMIKVTKRYYPQAFVAHSVEAEKPEECMLLMAHMFTVPGAFMSFGNLQNYVEWVNEQDLTETYKYYRKLLQLLQWHWAGERWVLKAPFHLGNLDVLFSVFPDACVVQIHRNPLEVMGSACSLLALGRGIFKTNVDLESIGDEILERGAHVLEKALKYRETIEPGRIYDVNYKSLVTDPIKIVQEIYGHFGYHYDDQMTAKMEQWLAINRQHKHGVHRYSIEQFGLGEEKVNRLFASYNEKFLLS